MEAPQRFDDGPARTGWAWTGRILSLVFLVVVLWLLLRYGRALDWDEVLRAVRSTPVLTLLAAAVLAACSHLLYSCFDLIGRHYTEHPLPTPTVMAVNFVSYAFNLCLGSLVGGIGLRYRLYSRLGLGTGVITRIITISMLTNWLGYTLVAGLLFMLQPLPLPPGWDLSLQGLRWLGGVLVLAALLYVAACVRYGDHVWWLRGHELYLPPWRVALLQLAMSSLNWSLMAGAVWFLLDGRVPYFTTYMVLLMGAIAGVITHVPGGLGVIEFVFVAMLSYRLPESEVIAGLLGYRAVYYVAPLAVAVVVYLVMEVHAKRRRATVGEGLS